PGASSPRRRDRAGRPVSDHAGTRARPPPHVGRPRVGERRRPGRESMSAVDAYRTGAAPNAVDIIMRLAERAQGRRVLHLTGGRLGGGPAESLRAAVPLLNDLGVETNWEVTGGDAPYFATVQALQAALQGAERVLTEERLEHYLSM